MNNKKKDGNGITTKLTLMLSTVGYTRWDHKCNNDVVQKLIAEPVLHYIHYQNIGRNMYIICVPAEYLKPCFIIIQIGEDFWIVLKKDGWRTYLESITDHWPNTHI